MHKQVSPSTRQKIYDRLVTQVGSQERARSLWTSAFYGTILQDSFSASGAAKAMADEMIDLCQSVGLIDGVHPLSSLLAAVYKQVGSNIQNSIVELVGLIVSEVGGYTPFELVRKATPLPPAPITRPNPSTPHYPASRTSHKPPMPAPSTNYSAQSHSAQSSNASGKREFPKALLNEIVNYMMEYFALESERYAIVTDAFGGTSIANQVSYAGSPLVFTVTLIRNLVQYGEVNKGEHSLVTLLQAVINRYAVSDAQKDEAKRLVGEVNKL